jgi:hypothetical protein
MRARSALLEGLGGEDGCKRLSAAFHARVGKDPVLRPFFPGKSLRCATEEFAAFLIQFLGADVGIAIGAGTDVAIESAGIVLVRSDPRDVVGAIRLSRATYRKMIQNLAWATAYNLVAIPVAAGVLVHWGIDLPMSVGAVAMSLSTIIVAANAQLLRRLELQSETL